MVQPHNGIPLRNELLTPVITGIYLQHIFQAKEAKPEGSIPITCLQGNLDRWKSDWWWSGDKGAAQGALSCHGTTLYGTMVVSTQLYGCVKTHRPHHKQ